MSIVYDPASMLKKIAPPRKIKKLLTGKVTLKKTALSFVNDIDFLSKKSITEVALKTVKGYQDRIQEKKLAAGDVKTAAELETAEILDDPKQLIQRVQNEVIFQIHNAIKTNYSGEQYEWLPSSAEVPDPEHQLNYGKVFTVGDGEMPGERYGCQCGMNILVKQTELELD